MEKDLRSYVKIFKKYIPEKVCVDIVEELQTNHNEFELHSYYDHMSDKKIYYENELSTSFFNVRNKNFITQKIFDCLHEYFQDLNSKNFVWFQSWSNFSSVRFNRYTTNSKMNIHCDHIHSLFSSDNNLKGIPILSILGSLNNDYLGGDLIFWTDEKIDLDQGDIMIFPSNFLYPHQVNKIESGTRFSFVSWAW